MAIQLNYIKYFFYLAYNWNYKIAKHILKNEIKGEKKYGIETTGADELKNIKKKGIDISHATIYMPVSYDVLDEFFTKAMVVNAKHFLDIGCGKGRVMCVAAANGLTKISGIELSENLYNDAANNLAITNIKYPSVQFQLTNADAFDTDIEADVDFIFMFNPFDDVVMCAVLENIEYSLEQNPRTITIIYINPLQKHLLLEWDYVETYHSKKLGYLEGSIFVKK